MNIDKQRIAAVNTLERQGYTWDGAALWKPPLGKPRQAPADLLQLETLCKELIALLLDDDGSPKAWSGRPGESQHACACYIAQRMRDAIEITF